MSALYKHMEDINNFCTNCSFKGWHNESMYLWHFEINIPYVEKDKKTSCLNAIKLIYFLSMWKYLLCIKPNFCIFVLVILVPQQCFVAALTFFVAVLWYKSWLSKIMYVCTTIFLCERRTTFHMKSDYMTTKFIYFHHQPTSKSKILIKVGISSA